MSSFHAWLLAGCAVLIGLASWRPTTRTAARSRALVFYLVGYVLVLVGGRGLAIRFGYPEHAYSHVWSLVALGLVGLLACWGYPARDPLGKGSGRSPRRVDARVKYVARASGVLFFLAALALSQYRDRTFSAAYEQCQALEAAARTPGGRAAVAVLVPDSTLKFSIRNSSAYSCRDILTP